MAKHNAGRVAVMVVGHREYWPQFPGGREEMLKNSQGFVDMLGKYCKDVVTYTAADGTMMCDTPEESYRAGVYFKEQDVDLVYLFINSYVASGRFVQGVMACCAPVVVVGYQIDRDYSSMKIEDDIFGGSPCPMPEACNALTRCLVPPAGVVFGEYYGGDRFAARFEREISEWCRVADALHSYKGAVFGHLGHSYEGMLDMNFDPTTFTKVFGIHVKMLEMCELIQLVEQVSEEEAAEKMNTIKETFHFLEASHDPTTRNVEEADVEWAARCSVGLDKLMDNHNLSGMAYYYEGKNSYERVAANLIIGNTLLVSQGRSLAGESDMRTCLAMYTTSAIGAGGSFAEIGSVSFKEDLVLVGHDGPHDIRISDGKPNIRALKLYHGKKGNGISVEFSLKEGPFTMLGLGMDEENRFSFIVAEGESRRGPIPQMGNTWTRGYFGENVSRFVEEWSNCGNHHHCALSIGHNASVLKKLAGVLGIGFRQIR